MTEQKTNNAASPTDSSESFGDVEAASAQNVKKGHRKAIAIGLIIAALVIVAIIAALFMNGAFTEDAPEAPEQRVALTEENVRSALDEADMTTPDTSQYAYVSQDTLSGPKFSNIVVNEPVDLGGGANQVVEATATATATFKNKGVQVEVAVTLPFDYDPLKEQWAPEQLTQGDSVAIPLSSPKASDIVDDLDAILADYDATYAEQMEKATVVKTKSDLSKDGGTISVDLSKTVEEKTESDTTNELRTCTVEIAVKWDNDKGWKASVKNAGEIDSQKSVIPNTDSDKDDKAAVEPANTEPEDLGKVKYGDTVKLTGTLQKIKDVSSLQEGNDYTNADASKNADGTVQLLLKLTRPANITLDGTDYQLKTIAVAVSGLDDDGKSLIGRKADVKGSLEEDFATSWSPAGIKALEIQVE